MHTSHKLSFLSTMCPLFTCSLSDSAGAERGAWGAVGTQVHVETAATATKQLASTYLHGSKFHEGHAGVFQ